MTRQRLPAPGLAALLALSILAIPTPIAGQAVAGRIVERSSGGPVDGAMVALMDSTGASVAQTLTNAVGRFFLEAPAPGGYVVRADRIGFSSAYSDTLRVAVGDTVVYRMEAAFEPVALEGISVEAEKQCRVRPEEGAATARVWDEARKALEAAAWTQERQGYTYRILNLERRLGPEGREVREEQRRRLQGFARNPISSRPAEELIREGFARQLADGDWMYYAPDARVLLSDAFLDTHCMGLREGEDARAGLMGLRFQPVEGRRTPDISGTLWLDPASSELRRLDYRYVNVERLLDHVSLNEEVGGDVVFRSLPNGSWIVQEWRIRMPLIARQGRPGEYQRVATLAALHEIGGLVQQVRTDDGETVLAAEMGTVTGAVVDSTGAEPLEGATVRLLGTGRTDRTDEGGRFRIGELQEGTYRITYSHPGLAAVGYEPEAREVEVLRGGVASVRFRAPSRSEALASSCRQVWADEAPEGVEVGTLYGVVRETDGGPPVSGATVQLFWSQWGFSALVERGTTGAEDVRDYQISENRWGAEARTGANGFYSVCGVPTEQEVKAVVVRDSIPGDTVSVELEGPVKERDLMITSAPPP